MATGTCALSSIGSYAQLQYKESGVYILRIGNEIKKVGSAKIGIKKRMQQYYNLNFWCGLNRYINKGNRDSIDVTFQTCAKKDCKELESKLFDKYDIDKMEWAKRRPHSKKNTIQLLI